MIIQNKHSSQYENLVGEVLIRGLMDYHIAEEDVRQGAHYQDPRIKQAKAWVNANDHHECECGHNGCINQRHLSFNNCCEVMGIDADILKSILQDDEQRALMYQRLRRASTSYRTSKSLKRSYRKRNEV